MEGAARTHAACLLVGALNPAIIQPPWLVSQGFSPDEAKLTVPLFGDAVPKFEFAGFVWVCTPWNLEIKRLEPTGDPGRALARVLESLPHTPVKAVGNNFHYTWTASADQLSKLLKSRLSEGLPTSELEFGGQSLTLKLAHKTAALSLAVDSSTKPASVRFNYHREAKSTKDAMNAALNWEQDATDSEEVLARVLELAR